MKTYSNDPYCLSSDNRGGYWVTSYTSTAEFHGTYDACVAWAKANHVSVYHDGRDILSGRKFQPAS